MPKRKPGPDRKRTLTPIAIKRLALPASGQLDYFDKVMPAFGVRLSHGGARSFFLMTRINGKQARLTLGRAQVTEGDGGLTLRDARLKAAEWSEMAARGIDPRQDKARERADNEARARQTFAVVVDRFIEQYVEPRLRASTLAGYRGVLRGSDVEPWRNRPLTSITRADVRAVLDGIVARGAPAAANNALAYLRKFFNWCAEKDLIEIPPTDRLHPPTAKRTGERVLTAPEIAEVWAAFTAEGGVFGDMFKVLLLTGQRRGEVAGMRWSELSDLDGETPALDLPGDRTKNHLPHIVPLAAPVIAIIKARPHLDGCDLLFSVNGKTASSGFSKAKARIDAWIASGRTRRGEPPMPAWKLHDLRRTMVTMMNERLSTPPHVVEAVVNHISGAKAGVAGVYNKALYLRERRAALDDWSGFVAEIVNRSFVKDIPGRTNT